jgi:hypothetical protein
MRIAENATSPLPRTTVPGRQVSHVSREERMQLLTKRIPSLKSEPAPNTYSERAQLLSASKTPQKSWVA